MCSRHEIPREGTEPVRAVGSRSFGRKREDSYTSRGGKPQPGTLLRPLIILMKTKPQPRKFSGRVTVYTTAAKYGPENSKCHTVD